jgi:hypothetical protein
MILPGFSAESSLNPVVYAYGGFGNHSKDRSGHGVLQANCICETHCYCPTPAGGCCGGVAGTAQCKETCEKNCIPVPFGTTADCQHNCECCCNNNLGVGCEIRPPTNCVAG